MPLNHLSRFLNGVCAVFFFVLILSSACFAGDIIAVIVNKGNSVDFLSESDIRRIYTNNMLEWADGASITIYDLSLQDNLRAGFSEKILGKPPYQVAEEWAHLKINNQAKNPPVTVKSQAIVIRKVSLEKGAIGYVSAGAVKDNPAIKIVRIIQ